MKFDNIAKLNYCEKNSINAVNDNRYSRNFSYTFLAIVMIIIVLFSYCQSDFIEEAKLLLDIPTALLAQL